MGSLSDLPVLGCLPRNEGIEIPSRHLGLLTDEDFGMDQGLIERLAGWIEDNIDLDVLAGYPDASAMTAEQSTKKDKDEGFQRRTEPTARIGIAMDEAFCFYYQENLRLLRKAGATLEFFSPIHSKHLPKGLNGLILGGGYPELHCRLLSENRTLITEIREFGLKGGPIYAECGGLMFLMKEIRDLDGQIFPITGIFPMAVQMENKFKALGYREVITRKDSMLGPSCTRIRGHEFHYSQISDIKSPVERIYSMTDRNRHHNEDEGFFKNRVLGSYVHLHWGSNPAVAENLVDYCRKHGV